MCALPYSLSLSVLYITPSTRIFIRPDSHTRHTHPLKKLFRTKRNPGRCAVDANYDYCGYPLSRCCVIYSKDIVSVSMYSSGIKTTSAKSILSAESTWWASRYIYYHAYTILLRLPSFQFDYINNRHPVSGLNPLASFMAYNAKALTRGRDELLSLALAPFKHTHHHSAQLMKADCNLPLNNGDWMEMEMRCWLLFNWPASIKPPNRTLCVCWG